MLRALIKRSRQAAIALLALLYMAPVIMLIVFSLMPEGQLERIQALHHIADLIPNPVRLKQYDRLLFSTTAYLGMFWNSLALTLTIVCLNVVVSTIVAYAFAKAAFHAKNALFFLYVVITIMPYQVTMLPNYMFAKWTGIYDNWWALILPSAFSPLGVFLLRGFMASLPLDVLDAAELETDNPAIFFRRVLLPMAKPGIIALCVLTFADSWNMVDAPMILIESAAKYPLSLALNSLASSHKSVMYAGGLLYVLPMIVCYLAFKEEIIIGIAKLKQ